MRYMEEIHQREGKYPDALSKFGGRKNIKTIHLTDMNFAEREALMLLLLKEGIEFVFRPAKFGGAAKLWVHTNDFDRVFELKDKVKSGNYS